METVFDKVKQEFYEMLGMISVEELVSNKKLIEYISRVERLLIGASYS